MSLPSPSTPPSQTPRPQTGMLIVTALMSLVVIKSLVMWMGAWYAEDPSLKHLIYLLGSIALSIANLIYFIYRYQKARGRRFFENYEDER